MSGCYMGVYRFVKMLIGSEINRDFTLTPDFTLSPIFEIVVSCDKNKKTPRRMCCGVFGGSRGSRTPDPLLVRQTLWTNWAMLPNKLAPEPGLEPGTLWLTVRCSNQLSYSGILSLLFRNGIAKVQQFLFPANFFLHFFANFVKIF